MTGRDLHRFSEFLRELYAIRDKQSFVAHLVSSLPTLLSGEVCSYNEIDPVACTAWYTWSPADYQVIKDGMAILGRYADQCPLVGHMQSPAGVEARRMSDLLSMAQFQRRDIYHEFYKPMRIPYTLATSVPNEHGVLIALGLHRERRDFSEQDRQFLDLVQPHIVQAFQNAKTVSRMNQEMAARDCALDQLNRGIVGVASDGKIEWATQTGIRLLQRHFPAGQCQHSHLPETVSEWLRHNRIIGDDPTGGLLPHDALIIQQGEQSLRIRYISKVAGVLLFLDECCERFPCQELQDLGLTVREGEVLMWMSRGKTNGEIAEILHLSPRTVQKHVEHIFDKLGVENRSTATAMVGELTRLPSK